MGSRRPAFLQHRAFPLLARRQYLVLGAAYLRLHDFELSYNKQPNLPSELVAMSTQWAVRLFFVNMNSSPSSTGEPCQS